MLLTSKDKEVLVSILKGCKPTTMITKYIALLSGDDPALVKREANNKTVDNTTVVFNDLPKSRLLALKEIRNTTGLDLKGCMVIYEIFLEKGVVLASDIRNYYLKERGCKI